jgi:hypothetical protein
MAAKPCDGEHLQDVRALALAEGDRANSRLAEAALLQHLKDELVEADADCGCGRLEKRIRELVDDADAHHELQRKLLLRVEHLVLAQSLRND